MSGHQLPPHMVPLSVPHNQQSVLAQQFHQHQFQQQFQLQQQLQQQLEQAQHQAHQQQVQHHLQQQAQQPQQPSQPQPVASLPIQHQQPQQQPQPQQQSPLQQQPPLQQSQQQAKRSVSTQSSAPPSAFEESLALEPLSCVTCRLRKLRCDRLPPACTRCLKGNTECVYPVSRRRPAVRRRNVRELEARLVHPGRYREAYYSAPHRRPPMCLQYAIWANASHEHPKYSKFHDFFYHRARQYAERDELKGHGEHFLTLGHAQAWVLLATEEARSLQFTRAAMSSARCVRLVQMMGLHRMDVEQEWSVPVLSPASSWVEQEERRRTFWSAYCIDSHASLSTGWPSLINTADIGTRLPSSEESFVSGQEEPAFMLDEAIAGSPYSTFAGAVMISYLFNAILRHVQRPKPDDNPGDLTGKFWKRHEKLDSVLANVFNCLPQQLRLPENIKDPSAIHTHLHLHASVICLHHQAVDKMNEFGLLDHKLVSEQKLLNSAGRIVELMRTTNHTTSASNYKSPLIALSMFCAASVYVYHLRDNITTLLPPIEMEKLGYVLSVMQKLATEHIITRSFLQQICSEIERHGLRTYITHPAIEKFAYAGTTASIPLISRGRKLYPQERGHHFAMRAPTSTRPHGYVPFGNSLPNPGTIIELSEDDHASAIYNSSGSQKMYESSVEISSPASSDSRMSPHSVTQGLPQQGHQHPRQQSQPSTQQPPVQHIQQSQALPQMPPPGPVITATPPVPTMSTTSAATPPDSWTFTATGNASTAPFVDPQYPVTSESAFPLSLPHRGIMDMAQAAHQTASDWSQQCVSMFQNLDSISSAPFNPGEQEAAETAAWDMMGSVPGTWTNATQ
ncbi:hypothetical protein TD95_002390 [Thielaviopsis punctulata]|uniref:Zn(2)-C6 fungal-type domain-containing protein n=1 Tax=Thielaviopsis punctulata TaxID=72032 RepID=A0A0F4ZB86_9PEZI|nr:hypothetical protein TD95_001704 [Thielaviopsis punctulata]KKA27550.1 hypothetical protein TD95_002390 [Thielaviopsis punctulata]